ncbi:VWA domain-containing protein [candidate division KSB1 bacterium]|nr:VWA domain-containing protein [candidate division KSB1 bacterium]
MQKYIFMFFILTTAFLGCRSTQKPVQVEKGPERQVEVPKVDDSKKDAQKHQEVDKPVKTEEWVVTDMAFRERKGKNMPLQSFQLLSKSVAVGNFTTAKPDILPIPHNTEEYSKINDNVFLSPGTNPLSTFSIDVDAASYANVRRFLNSGQLPYKDAVRIEELVNYFNYDYEDPKGEHPFSVTTEVSQAPWNPDHKLVHIGLQGKKLDYEDMKPSNLVFLVDVSGSMKSPNKLSLLKSAFKLLVKNLDDRDRIAIVAYAGAAGLVLPSTPVKERSTILSALDKLEAGGSTAGGAGIKLAYKVAKENLIEDGNNRVILATDGDFNVGVSSTSELVRTIEEKRNDGIFLTICGFGMGNYKDGRMESISNAGNGNYFYIDNIMEANKVFVKEMRATLFTIAKDVKIQIEFNPAKVQAYRLIGYENRMLKSEDFNDDKKDAGELGAGHTVTALYEIIPVGVKSDFIKSVDELKYQKGEVTNQASSDELMTVKLRYKKPKEDKSRLLSIVIKDKTVKLAESSDNFKFASAVAEFGMLLRDSEFKGQASYENVLSLANSAKGSDSEGYRSEFVQLVKKASFLIHINCIDFHLANA